MYYFPSVADQVAFNELPREVKELAIRVVINEAYEDALDLEYSELEDGDPPLLSVEVLVERTYRKMISGDFHIRYHR